MSEKEIVNNITQPQKLSRKQLAIFIATFGLIGTIWVFASQAATTATVSGVAFKDVNRNGVFDQSEEPLADKRIYVFNEAGDYLKNSPTDATGHYVISDLVPGTYKVRYGTVNWWELYRDWAPSTLANEQPEAMVNLTNQAIVNFGWRPIVRSTDIKAPISTYLAPDGVRFNSYNDVVDAKRLYDALKLTLLHGAEAPFTTVNFDFRPDHFCDISAAKVNNVWGSYRALCYISYTGWLSEGDVGLVHEYGHAWSQYYAYVVQQDPTLQSYLEFRGLAGDTRLRSSSTWNPNEIIAEDYRQLFGSAYAAAWPQDNKDIPLAAAIPGLRDFLMVTFMQKPVAVAAPINLSGQGTSQSTIQLTWTAGSTNEAISKYNVYRNGTFIGYTNAPTTTFADGGLTASTAYQYKVQAVDATGHISPDSATITVSTLSPDTQPPSQPSGLRVGDSTSSSLSLTWTASTDNVGVKEYRVYQLGGRKGTVANIVGTTTGVSYTVTGLTANKSYSFYVVAVDAAGNLSQPSSILAAKTKR